MSSQEKPPIRGRTAPLVSDEASRFDAFKEHRDDIFFAAIETTRMPMLVTDPRQPDNPIVFVNRAFLSMTGYAPEEVVGANCRFLQGPQTDRSTVAAVREAIEARREITVEILNYRKDGSSFWNALFISPVYNQREELVFYFASQLDVSRRRDAEEGLAQAQKMEALGQLTGGIAHDFNNLLQVMSGYVDLVASRARKGDIPQETAARSATNLRGAISKASSLTQQLLAFARKQRLEGRVVNLNAVVENLAEMLGRTVGEAVQLRLTLGPGLDNCRLDPTQLELALINILVNARDAMPGGGTVTIETREQEVETEDAASFPSLQPGRYIAISVTDTGTGIPAEILQRVMDPFFTTKEEGKGTGLGLSMVHGFAKQSGGSATIYSEAGTGTTVRMYFPATSQPGSAESQRPERPAERGGDEFILVVDDRVEVAELAREMLEGLGYKVEVGSGGKQALEMVKALPEGERPDLLFSDVIMPGGMNGFALAREIRSLAPGIKVLLTTGYASAEEEAGSGGGAEFDVLRKPYRLSELARRARAALDGETGAHRRQPSAPS